MPSVQVTQRHAHLAGAVKLEQVNGREGPVAKATFTAISNTRRTVGEERQEETASILWTVWGKAAENAAQYLGKGSHVNVVGTLRNNNFENAEGATVYALAFTAEDIDYLENKAQADARRSRHEFVDEMNSHEEPVKAAGQAHGSRLPRPDRSPQHGNGRSGRN